MHALMKACIASALLHTFLGGGALLLSRRMESHPPFVEMDLSMLEEGGSTGGGGKAGPSEPVPEPGEPFPALQVPAPSAQVQRGEATPEIPVFSSETDAAPVLAALPAPVGASPCSGGRGEGSGGGEGSGAGVGLGSGTGSGTGSGIGSGKGDGFEVLRALYREQHLRQIRAQVLRSFIYPRMAIKAGWSGHVRLLFLILENGEVQDIRVAKSSGIPLLDRDAQDTIRRAAPFPKPPVRTSLSLPVEYALE